MEVDEFVAKLKYGDEAEFLCLFRCMNQDDPGHKPHDYMKTWPHSIGRFWSLTCRARQSNKTEEDDIADEWNSVSHFYDDSCAPTMINAWGPAIDRL